MSRIPPPSSVIDAAIRPVTDTHTSLATLDRPPQAVLRLPPGTQISGVVIGPDGKGGIQVQSAHGTLTLNTRANLPQGSQITIQVDGNTPQSRTVTVTLRPAPRGIPSGTAAPAAQASGQPATVGPATTGAARAASAAPPSAAAADTAAGRPAAILGNTRSITATVTRPAPAGANPPLPPQAAALLRPVLAASAPPSLVPGSQLSVRVVALEAPAANAPRGATPAPAAPNTPLAAAPATPAPAPPGTGAPGQTQAVTPAPGQSTPATVAQPLPGTPHPSPAVSAGINGVLVAATVIGNSNSGQPVLQTALGELTLAARANLSPGSRATLEIASVVPAPAPRPSTAQPPTGLDLSRDWPALKEALAALQQIDPAGAGRTAAEAIPRPGPGLANDLLFLIAAMRLGDLRSWLGQSANQALTAAKPGLAGRLGEDFNTLTRFAGETPSGEWRAYFLPVHDGHDLRQIRVFTRRQKRKNAGADDDDAATRFVVEVDLSQIGPLQLDGLAHEGRFDLIVRSHTALPDEVRRDIAAIFSEVRGGAQWEGDLGFQAMPVFPVTPLEETDDRHIGVVV